MRRASALSAALLAAACASTTPPPKPAREATPIVGAEQAPGAILYAWTQIVPEGALARAVVEGPGQPCPEIALDGLPAVQMTPRPGHEHPITLCEHPLAQATRAQVADRLLPIPGNVQERIAVLGTEIEAGAAKTLARRQMPTLVVYTGERGGTWEEWKRGFFEPAGELLQVAPWRMAGGRDLLGPLPGQSEDAFTRLYKTLAGEAHGSLMLISKGSNTWEATLSSPKGDESFSCRLEGDKFDCQ